jgi:hypothetical protein
MLQNERNPYRTGCSNATAFCYKPLRAVGRSRPAAVCIVAVLSHTVAVLQIRTLAEKPTGRIQKWKSFRRRHP